MFLLWAGKNYRPEAGLLLRALVLSLLEWPRPPGSTAKTALADALRQGNARVGPSLSGGLVIGTRNVVPLKTTRSYGSTCMRE